MEYKHNDYELLYLISENNEDAKDLLYKKYKKLVEIKAKKYYSYVKNFGVDYNDLFQEAMIGFTKASNKFKESKNTEFSTFVNKCIDFHLLSYCRSITNGKNIILNTSLSVDEILDSGLSIIDFMSDKNEKTPEEIVCNNELMNKVTEVMNNDMSKLEKNVFNLKSKGCTYKEISEILKITIKSAEHAYSRAKNKLEKVK